MPIIYSNHIEESLHIGLWYIVESNNALIARLNKYASDISDVLDIQHERQQRSSLAARLLIHNLLDDLDEKMAKDDYGKPYLESHKFHIGLSHSESLAAAIISPNKCGIDVQVSTMKVSRIAKKFLHEEELTEDPRALHLIWCAKEAIYKADGKKSVEFKRDIIIELEDINLNFGSFKGQLKRKNKSINYNLNYEIWNNYYLVYALEI